MEIIFEKIVKQHISKRDYEKAMWYYELLTEQLKKKKEKLQKGNSLNNDIMIHLDYKLFIHLRG